MNRLKKSAYTLKRKAIRFYIENRRNKRFKLAGKFAESFVRDIDVSSLSKKEEIEIDEYWKQFGVKFYNYDWFRMYYYVTGIRKPYFIPNNFADKVLYEYYNDRTKSKAWADKNQFNRILPMMPFPISIAHRINGKYYDNMRRCYGDTVSERFLNDIYDFLLSENIKELIVKESLNTNRGLGVLKFQIESMNDLVDLFSNCKSKNYIVQKKIKQHKFFDQFNKSSVNIVRITTWRNGNEIKIFSPSIRFGIKGAYTDVTYVGGREVVNCIGIKDNGIIKNYSVDLKGSKNIKEYKHTKVPLWNQMLELVKYNHTFLDYFDVVAWDLTVDENEGVVCIEYNINAPGTIAYQMANGPLAENSTDEFLQFLKNPENQIKYLPKCIRYI